MKSWRIDVQRRDKSGTVIVNTNVTGAMVIRSAKGTTEPVFINTGDERALTDYFGIPGVLNASGVAGYSDVWEAIEYNRVGPMWVSGPPGAADTMGGVWVTESGLVPFASGVTETGFDSITFPAVLQTITDTIGTGDGAETDFTGVLDFSVATPSTDLGISVNGTALSVTVSGTAPNYTIAATELTSGTYDSSTKTVTLAFVTAPTDTYEVDVVYKHSAVPYFAIMSYSPCVDDLKMNAVWDNVNKWFDFELYQRNYSTQEYALVSEFSGAQSPSKLDGFGASIYIGNTLEGNHFVRTAVNTATVTEPTTTFITEDVVFTGGTRSQVIGTTEITAGWAYFQNSDTYDAAIFMDPTSIPSVVTTFNTLATTYQLYKSFIVKLPLGLASTAAIAAKTAFGLNNPDIAIYYNNGKVLNTYTNNQFWTSLVGPIGKKYALMYNIYNAGGPYWTDENGHGGLLDGLGIIELERTLTEDELRACDTAGLNPITFKPAFGPMIESQKTAKTPSIISDYSYVAHNRLFNYIISNVLNTLYAQIGKLNDENHRLQRKTEAELIVNPIRNDGWLRESQVICDKTNNTDAILAQRKFILDIVVKVTPFSEFITLRFTNVGQTVSVSTVI